MPRRMPTLFVVDVLISIDRIKRYCCGVSCEEFMRSDLIYNAAMKEFANIGEALKYVLELPSLSEHKKHHWREIIDFRNVIIHEYFGINYDELYYIIQEDLPIFEVEYVTALSQIDDVELRKAFKSTIKDLSKFEHNESISYLIEVEKKLKK